jgi:hypothetical protein
MKERMRMGRQAFTMAAMKQGEVVKRAQAGKRTIEPLSDGCSMIDPFAR